MAFYKNQSGQKLPFALIDSNGDRVTGEASNITAQISKDGGSLAATNDTNPSELGSSGLYLFDATQAESNADFIYVEPSHATYEFDPPFLLIFTTPGANTGIHSNLQLWKDDAPADLADTDKIPASVQHIPDGSFTAAKFGANFLTADKVADDVSDELAAKIETFIVNEGDATAVMQAIADLIATDWVAGDASPLAIVEALKADAEWQALSTFDPSSDKVTLADGVVHGGTSARLVLGTSTTDPALHVTNSNIDGYAVRFQNSGINGTAFDINGGPANCLTAESVIIGSLFTVNGQNVLTTANYTGIANGVWNRALSSHTTAGTAGKVLSDIGTRITSTLFSGITSLASWLGALAGKTADASTLAEIQATTAGAGFNNVDDSLQAIRDRGDEAWTGGGGGGSTFEFTTEETVIISEND